MGRKTHGHLVIDAIEKNDLNAVSNTLTKHFKNRSKIKNFLWSKIPRLLFETETEVPMLLASILQDSSILNYFVTSHGADVNHLFTSGCPKKQKIKTCLITAVRAGCYNVVGYLLSIGCDVNRCDHKLRTPLHHAVRKSDYTMAKLLISKGALTNNPDIAGNTPLHISTLHGHLQLVKLLVRSGSDIYKRGHFGATALHMAAREGHGHLVDVYCGQMEMHPDLKVVCYGDVDQACTHLAAERGHMEVIRCLLEDYNADLDVRDSLGRSALHRCFPKMANPFDSESFEAKERQAETCRFLIELGANLNLSDNTGDTSLHFATKNGYEKGVQILLSAGAACGDETRNIAGDSPLDITGDKSGLTASILKQANHFSSSRSTFNRSSSARLNSWSNLTSSANGSAHRLPEEFGPKVFSSPNSRRSFRRAPFNRTFSSPGTCEDETDGMGDNEYIVCNTVPNGANGMVPKLNKGGIGVGNNVSENYSRPDIVPYIDQSPDRQMDFRRGKICGGIRNGNSFYNRSCNNNNNHISSSNNNNVYIHPLGCNDDINGPVNNSTEANDLMSNMTSSLAYNVIDDDEGSVTTTIKNFKTESLDGILHSTKNYQNKRKKCNDCKKSCKSEVSSSIWTVTPAPSSVLSKQPGRYGKDKKLHYGDCNGNKSIKSGSVHRNNIQPQDDYYSDDDSFDTVSSSSSSSLSSSSSSSLAAKAKIMETNFDDDLNSTQRTHSTSSDSKSFNKSSPFNRSSSTCSSKHERRTPPPIPDDNCRRLFVILLDSRQVEGHDIIRFKPAHPPGDVRTFVVKKELSRNVKKLFLEDEFLTKLSKSGFQLQACLKCFMPVRDDDFDSHLYENLTMTSNKSTKYIMKQIRNNSAVSSSISREGKVPKYVWIKERIKCNKMNSEHDDTDNKICKEKFNKKRNIETGQSTIKQKKLAKNVNNFYPRSGNCVNADECQSFVSSTSSSSSKTSKSCSTIKTVDSTNCNIPKKHSNKIASKFIKVDDGVYNNGIVDYDVDNNNNNNNNNAGPRFQKINKGFGLQKQRQEHQQQQQLHQQQLQQQLHQQQQLQQQQQQRQQQQKHRNDQQSLESLDTIDYEIYRNSRKIIGLNSAEEIINHIDNDFNNLHFNKNNINNNNNNNNNNDSITDSTSLYLNADEIPTFQHQNQLQQRQNGYQPGQQFQQQQQQQKPQQHPYTASNDSLYRKPTGDKSNNFIEKSINIKRNAVLNFSLSGGNIDGVMVVNCWHEDGDEDNEDGLMDGDELKEVDGRSVAGRTKEEVFKMLTSNGEPLVKLKINRKLNRNVITTPKLGGDRFFVKACFDYDPSIDNHHQQDDIINNSNNNILAIKKGDIFCILDSLPFHNRMGAFWRAVHANGSRGEGYIPNRKHATTIVNDALQSEAETASEKKRVRGSSLMRSFRKSKSVDSEKREYIKSSDIPIPYVNIMLVAPEVKRPVFVVGLFADIVCRRLIADSPGLYEIPDDVIETNRQQTTSTTTSPQSASINLKPLIDISKRRKHAVCCLSPSALTFIRNSTTLDPITIFLSPTNKNVITEVARRLSKLEVTSKKAAIFLEDSLKFEKTYSHLFDAIIPFNSDDSWFAILKDTVDKIQIMPKWRTVELVDDISDEQEPNTFNSSSKFIVRETNSRTDQLPSQRHSKTTDDIPDTFHFTTPTPTSDSKKKLSPLKSSASSNNLLAINDDGDDGKDPQRSARRKLSDFSVTRKGSRIKLNF